MSLKNSPAAPPRVALITGAARRIGRALALGMAARGWDVALHFRASASEAHELVAEIEALGRRALALSADLENEAETAQLVPECSRRLGVPYCVVNNASLFEPDSATDFSYAAFERLMRVNLAAPLLLARGLFEACSQNQADTAGPRGVVINLLDQKLFNLNPDYLSYTLAKAALQTATVTLAQAFAPTLRVVGVAPGLTLPSGPQSDAAFAEAHRQTPLGYSSRLEDVVGAVCYMAEADAVTGTTLLVDGGQHLLPLPRDVMFMSTL
jgi:NAD(P)-dependent dehydrogenase (short-subunit alcohol dehydrogenase family)